MEQRTDEWLRVRLGKVTASRLADVMAKTKSGYGASRENYMTDLLVERLTGSMAGGFTNSAMEWGIEHEKDARLFYAFLTEQMVTEVGFVPHPEIADFGASPDGLVGTDGLVEIKCPNTKTHIETLITDKIARKYILQMHAQMMCTGREWCDFVSYDPRLPDHMQLYVQRVHRDDELVEEIETEVTAFLDQLSGIMNALNGDDKSYANIRVH
jgi:putative phage-type endonuclease